MSTTTMTIRTDKEVKFQAQQIFSELGMDMTTAINVFLRQAIRQNGFPFPCNAACLGQADTGSPWTTLPMTGTFMGLSTMLKA